MNQQNEQNELIKDALVDAIEEAAAIISDALLRLDERLSGTNQSLEEIKVVLSGISANINALPQA